MNEKDKLPINLITSSLNSTSTSYKFYWFLALLEETGSGRFVIPKKTLFASMIANAWYPINYFHLNFGKQDQLQKAIGEIIITEGLSIDASKNTIITSLQSSKHPITVEKLKHFDNEVPHRFLSPWFPILKGLKDQIYLKSKDPKTNSLYAIDKDEIVIHTKWKSYLEQNSGILKSFCYWNLASYIQKRNPNVPEILNKLVKSPKRKNLNKHRKEFWDIVIKHNGPIKCIYTQDWLDINEYEIDHFIPYGFVSHDLMWNLIPASKSFNSRKSDKLPAFKHSFDSLFNMQILALETRFKLYPQNKFLQEYLTIIPDLNLINKQDKSIIKELFGNNIHPLLTIASNNGFEYMEYFQSFTK
jgi:hypothetical protein